MGVVSRYRRLAAAGQGGSAGLSSSSTMGSPVGPRGGWIGQAVMGGPVEGPNTLCHRVFHCSAHGQ